MGVTRGSDRKWLEEFGRKCVINFTNKRKALIQQARFSGYKINEETMDSFLEKAFQDNQIILFGVGAHHSQESYDILSMFIKHLTKLGYRDVFVELPHSFTWFYNKYLLTGDVQYYRIIGDEGGFFKKMQRFNSELSSSEKIRVWGIDLDHLNHALTYQIEEYLKVLSNAKLKDEILLFLSPFWMQNKEIRINIMESLEEIFKRNKKELIKNSDSEEFKRIYDLIRYSKLSSKALKSNSNELREKFLKKMFTHLYAKLLKEGRNKVVGIFGNWYTAKYTFRWDCDFQKLGEYLNNTYKNKVYSIDILPLEGECYNSVYTNVVKKINIPRGSIEDILAKNIDTTPFFVDITSLKDYTFYDRAGYFVSSATYDAVILYKSSTPSRLLLQLNKT